MATRKKPAKPTAKKSAPKKRTTKPAASKAQAKKAPASRLAATKNRISAFLVRRPHRSFRRTPRRDYVRSLQLPGYFAFTVQVVRHLRQHWKTFGLLIFCYMIATVLLAGVASQSMYVQLSDTLVETSGDLFQGGWGEAGKTGLLLLSGMTGGFTPQLTDVQQVFAGLIFLLAWLSVVWLLRAQLAGNTPRLRDALYNAGAPIIPLAFISLLFVLQMVPMALAIIGYNTALTTGFLENGFIAMPVSLVALLLGVLSLYLVTSTFFAMVVATLPGMYPWQALRTAGDIVTGRRTRLLLRLLFMLAVVGLAWVAIMLPFMLGVGWLQSNVGWLAQVPIVPAMLLFLSSLSIVFISSYVYLLYRKVIEDESRPA